MNLEGLTAITLPEFPVADELLLAFRKKVHNLPERERIAEAQQLAVEFLRTGNSHVFPGVPERQDWWFLIQLIALDRYVDEKGTPLPFSLTGKRELWVETFSDKDESSSLALRKSLTFADLRQQLEVNGAQLLMQSGFDAKQYQLRLLRADEFLRLANVLGFGCTNTSTYLDAFRLQPDGTQLPLIAGNSLLGGARYFDSWWADLVHHHCIPRFVIASL